jgi:UDP-N-acetylglucosamine transferase subunit ALG13
VEESAFVLSRCYLWRYVDLIAVLLGTNPYSFTRLVNQVDFIASESNMHFYVQLGNTKNNPKYCEYERFVDHKKLLNKIYKSELVVSHGGFGSIRDALMCKKPVVAVPRRPELGESQDFQEELVRELEASGRLIGVYDINQLYSKIQEACTKKFHYGSQNNICKIINTFLKNQHLCM